MKLGGNYIPIIGINDFPDETYPAILEPLNRARMEYRWVTRFICLSKEEGKKETAKKEKAHRGSRTTFLQSFAAATSGPAGAEPRAVNHAASVKEADSIGAGVEIDTDVASLGYYTSNVMVWDPDYRTALKKAEIAARIINSAGFTCKEEKYNCLEAFISMMPVQPYANYRALPVMSYNLSHVIPLSSVGSGMKYNGHAGRVTGVDLPHITCGTQEGTPFFLSLNPGDVGHTALWGPTGAGKSTILNLLEAQFYKYPESRVIVFDKGKSCRGICLASGGLFYEPAAESPAGIAFQPLRDLESDRDIIDAMDFIESLITVNGNEATPAIRAAIKETLEILQDKPLENRTLTSFIQYCQYMDPDTKRPVFKDLLSDYLYEGGKYGKIFDSAYSGLSLDARFLAIEMEQLMSRGEGCIAPAMVHLFNLIEKKFDGRLTLLVLDEAWLFLRNGTFAEKIMEWLKVLRKKNVFVVFATQDVADVEQSPLKTTVIQQCLTKIYLADPNAVSPGMIGVYRAFGLTDTEIGLIASATMKRDYFYTSPLGRRMFQLDLGPLTLALTGSPDHKLLDSLAAEKGAGTPLCRGILEHYRVDYRRLMLHDAPEEKEGKAAPAGAAQAPPKAAFVPPAKTVKAGPLSLPVKVDAAAVLDAVSAIGGRGGKGGGRIAERLSKQLGVGTSTVYLARNILKYGGPELIEKVRKGEIGIKKAGKALNKKQRSDV
jgi:type IV secretion system protein VirB4